jgi:hypothetical protein
MTSNRDAIFAWISYTLLDMADTCCTGSTPSVVRENAHVCITKQRCPDKKRLYIITTTARAEFTQ